MIRVIDAAGSPEEIGTAVGRAVAASVRDVVLRQPEFLKARATFAGSDYLAELRDRAEAAYPAHMRELDAMAAAAGVAAEDLFIWNCRGDLRFEDGQPAPGVEAPNAGCTSILVPADPDAGTPALIAHNEDGTGAFLEHRYWLRARPDGAPGFESFLYPGMLAGHSMAVNGAGLVMTINNVRPWDLKPGVPRHLICRAVLDAETIPDAIGHLARDDRASGFHHNIGIAGEARPLSVEAPASGAVVRTAARPMAHANHLLDDAFTGLGQTVTASSAFRQDAADTYLAEDGDPLTPEAVLFRRGDDGGESVFRRPGDGGDDYGCTLATGVFRIHADRVAWTVHADPDNRDVLGGTVPGRAPD